MIEAMEKTTTPTAAVRVMKNIFHLYLNRTPGSSRRSISTG